MRNIKTAGEIESDMFNLIRNSSLKAVIRGGIYRKDTRPHDSKTEDMIVSFLAGRGNQFQRGVVVLNVYIPDIDNGQGNGKLIKDTKRCTQIEVLLKEFLRENFYFNGYNIEPDEDEAIHTLSESGINQHFVVCRIKYKRITN